MSAHVISAVPIPFSQDGQLDLTEYESLLTWINPHVHGALVAGTTGEFPALDDEERLETFRLAADVLGADRTIAHLGHASARQVLRLAERTASLGIRRFALLSPYYLPTDQDGVVAFFQALVEEHPTAEVYAYLFPERTGLDVSVETLRRVMQLPGMRGVKLSGAAAAALPQYATALTGSQELYSGDDATMPQVVAAGGTGVVSGVSSAFPQTFAALATALHAGRADEVATLQAQVIEVVQAVGPTISRLKLALATRTGAPWAHRMALPQVDEATASRIRALTNRLR